MTYEQFKTDVVNRVRECLPAGTTVSLQKFSKNNGIELDGIVISGSESNVAPTIYLNFYYERLGGILDTEAVCRDIMKTYEHNRYPGDMDVGFFKDYEQIKERLAYRVISYERNEELLQTVPHVRYLDLAVVFYYLLQTTDENNATILIHSNHLECWGATKDELYQQACLTTPVLLPYDFRCISAVLSEALDDEASSEMCVEECPIYVLTNSRRLYGASCVLYEGVLEKIAEELDNDLFVLPSSIHEVVIIPASDAGQAPELVNMVTEINQTEVGADEVLSDSVYYYSRAEKSLSVHR